MHLHGHDFAIIAINETGQIPYDNPPIPDPGTYKLTNPPRRDVVMTPQKGGYVVIAFKTDNPGTWLMHCHIAFHASFGLALQFLERQQDAADLWPSYQTSPAIAEAQRVCNNWNKWWGDCRDWWPGDVRSFPFPAFSVIRQADSRITIKGIGCPAGNEAFTPDSGI